MLTLKTKRKLCSIFRRNYFQKDMPLIQRYSTIFMFIGFPHRSNFLILLEITHYYFFNWTQSSNSFRSTIRSCYKLRFKTLKFFEKFFQIYFSCFHFQGCSYVVPSKLKCLKEIESFDISQIEGPSAPNDLISTKLPEKHKFEAGFHLEMIHPITFKSLERFAYFFCFFIF